MSNLVEEAIDLLHVYGGRMTDQRRLILETLETLDSHPSAEELHFIVREQDPKIHLSTIYRTLRWLEQEGLVSSRWFEEDRRQERFDPALPIEHHHFICTQCKKVIEFDDPMVRSIMDRFEEAFEAQIKETTIVLYGICSKCKKKSK
jgi:Fe2+ or Zn2+ uptake regulation protein